MIAVIVVALLGVGATRVALLVDEEEEENLLFFGDDIELQREIAHTKMENLDKPQYLVLRQDTNAIIFTLPELEEKLLLEEGEVEMPNSFFNILFAETNDDSMDPKSCVVERTESGEIAVVASKEGSTPKAAEPCTTEDGEDGSLKASEAVLGKSTSGSKEESHDVTGEAESVLPSIQDLLHLQPPSSTAARNGEENGNEEVGTTPQKEASTTAAAAEDESRRSAAAEEGVEPVNPLKNALKFLLCAGDATHSTQSSSRVVVQRRILENSSICCICFDQPHDSAFLDCGHGGVCFKCAIDTYVSNRGLCPFCRSHTRQIVTLDMKEELEDKEGRKMYRVVGPNSSALSPWSNFNSFV